MTYIIWGQTYNMTTGCTINNCSRIDRLMCHHGDNYNLYFGCMLAGGIVELIIILILFFIICIVQEVIPHLIKLKTEVYDSFESAQNMTTKYVVLDINGDHKE